MHKSIKGLQLNRFKQVHCIKPRDLYHRLGSRNPNINFESSEEPIPMNMNKLEQIEYIQKFDQQMQFEALKRSEEANNHSSQNDDNSSSDELQG